MPPSLLPENQSKAAVVQIAAAPRGMSTGECSAGQCNNRFTCQNFIIITNLLDSRSLGPDFSVSVFLATEHRQLMNSPRRRWNMARLDWMERKTDSRNFGSTVAVLFLTDLDPKNLEQDVGHRFFCPFSRSSYIKNKKFKNQIY